MSERARALEQAQIAERIAREAHAGQVDRVNGRPYIEHVERVAGMVSGDEAKAVAWLHDVLEDSDVTPEALEAAGISDRVILAVRHLTRYEPRIYGPYIDRLRAGQLAAQVKIADLRDHLTPSCPESLRPRYEAALALLAVDPPPSGAGGPLMLRARALEQARATALKARLEAAHKKLCEACANGGRIRMSIPTQPDDTDIVIGRALSEAIAYFTEAMLAVDPPPSGASPQAEPHANVRALTVHICDDCLNLRGEM